MATDKQQRFYQLRNGMWVDAMTGQQAPELLYLKEAMISNASSKAQAQAAKVEREHPEQYEAWLYDETNLTLPKPSDYSTFLNTVNEMGDILKRPSDRIGFLPQKGERGGGTVDIVESALPTYWFGNGLQEARQGNTGKAIGSMLLGGASALTGPTVKILPWLNKIPVVSRLPLINQVAPWVARNYAEAKAYGKAENAVTSKPSTPVYPYAQTRDMSMTAEEYAKMAEANKNRTDAQGRSGMGATSVLPGRPRPEFDTFEPPAPLAPGTSIATIPPPAQLPLTPDQMDYYGEEMSGINRLYSQTLADIAQQQEQGQLGYARIGQAAQRQAAGAAVDIGNQMAGSGIGSSPAAAFGAEQMVQAPLVQKRQANRLNLDQLLSQLQKQKTQAGTTMDTSKLNLRRWEAMQRAANTSGQVQAGYQNSLGGM